MAGGNSALMFRRQVDTAVHEQNNMVNDDWTRNWQARVAIKITAIFLWVIILSGFGAVIYVTQDLEQRIENEIERELDAVTHHVHDHLQDDHQNEAGFNRDELRAMVEDRLSVNAGGIIEHALITGARIVLGDQVIEVGDIGGDLHSLQRPLAYKADAESGLATGYLEGFFYETGLNATATRQRLIIGVVAVLLLFGMLLSFTIQQVLSKPFNVLMQAIQGVSNGDLALRLDVSREDEFGHLSRFFNQMLDRVQIQQQELTEANRELTTEIAVRQEAEQQLRANQDQLEKLVDERTQDLAIARDQALAASQTKSAFIANVSHEIRTPLTPIIGFAEALLHGSDSEQHREQSLRTIIRNGKHLSRIINEILDLSKIEANSLDVESIPVDIFEVLADVRSIADMLVQEKGLIFEIQHQFPLPAMIFSDPTRIKQILMNLVTNAIKFTGKGRVAVGTHYNKAARQLELVVTDTGVGIEKDKIDRLFRPFSQADYSTTREFGGTGLGLYISKRLARLLGGDITLDSVSGVGTRCVVTLSVGVDEPELIYSSPLVPTNDRRPTSLDAVRLCGRLLLAEDSPDIQRLMLHSLSRTGLEVTAVGNGALAVEAALAGDFQLILMDMQMPVMGGMEAVTLLRNAGYKAPIVALTANAMKEDRERYQQVGCDGFLSKPVDQEQLRQVLQEFFPGPDVTTDQARSGESEEDEKYLELVGRFIDGLEEYGTRMAVALDESRFDVVRDLAHQLKGMGGSFGYPAVTERAAELEVCLRSDDQQCASKAGRSFIEFLEAIRHSA